MLEAALRVQIENFDIKSQIALKHPKKILKLNMSNRLLVLSIWILALITVQAKFQI
jgi:hypothetical protein